jgi:hypothetical protein
MVRSQAYTEKKRKMKEMKDSRASFHRLFENPNSEETISFQALLRMFSSKSIACVSYSRLVAVC